MRGLVGLACILVWPLYGTYLLISGHFRIHNLTVRRHPKQPQLTTCGITEIMLRQLEIEHKIFFQLRIS